MAGHSKWANIRHRKERVDAKRGKVFSRLVKEIYIATRLGGPDTSANPRLRLALAKAKEANLPKDNIDKAIKRGSGQLDGLAYEEIRYEGYGPEGVAIIVDCLTDNRNRSSADVRHAFSKHGGNLGIEGSVAFMFEKVGQIIFAPGDDQEDIVNQAIENEVKDVNIAEDGSIEVITFSEKFHENLTALEEIRTPDSAELTMQPATEIELTEDQSTKVQKLINALEDCDDTQQIYCNTQIAQ